GRADPHAPWMSLARHQLGQAAARRRARHRNATVHQGQPHVTKGKNDRLALSLACFGVNEGWASGRTSARLKSTPLTTVKHKESLTAGPQALLGTCLRGAAAFSAKQPHAK